MRWTRNVVAGGSLALVATATTLGALGLGSDPAPADAAAGKVELLAQKNISLLKQNLNEVSAQQKLERAEAAAVLDLPAGTAFVAPESFEGLRTQVNALEAQQRSRSFTKSAAEEPSLYWYEEGFFTSLMAIDWQCAWLSTGVAQVESGEMDDVRETVETLRSFASTEYASAFPDYAAFLTDQVDPLLEGETDGARSFFPNCSASTLADG